MMTTLRLLLISTVLTLVTAAGALCAAEKWPGVDEAVVGRIARENGRTPSASFLPQAEGDLQLFLFLLAGAVGGFAAGYYWRVLLEGRSRRRGDRDLS